MRRKGKIDANHRAVVEHLEAIGCSVQSLAALGKGVPDLLVGRRCVNVLIEVKDGEQAPSRRQLTADQWEWHKHWRGQIGIAHSPEEAEAIVVAAEKWVLS